MYKKDQIKKGKMKTIMKNRLIKFDKLVRDKISDIILRNGQIPVIATVNENNFSFYLKNKLLEEIEEFFNEETIEELADILEVIYTLCDYYQLPFSLVEQIRMKKLNTNGGFSKKIILKEVK